MVNLVVKTSPLFNQTLHDKINQGNKRVSERLQDFLNTKKQNPLQPFGSSDKPFTGDHLKKAVPNETMLHAHLTHDISIIYSLSGKDPKILKLYGIFSHDEMGTGQPPNLKKQKQIAARLNNAGQVT